jgi:RHS repeat-associated protein
MDDKQRIALVETRTQGSDPAPAQLIRYQLGNHLGSASLELDDQAQIISYEEYYPYGSTSYQAVRSQTETPKRYRYTGKERDEESGLSYHGARYYAVWLGRWIACDPVGIDDGPNEFVYVSGQPVVLADRNGRQGQQAVGGLTVSPESKITASQIVEMIQRSTKIPDWMKAVFSVQGNRILVKTQFRLPPNVTQKDIPEWFLSAARAIQSGDWHLTTAAANVSKRSLPPNEKLQGDFELGDAPIGGPKSEGIILGETIDAHPLWSRIGLRKVADENAGGATNPLRRRPPSQQRPAQGLVVVANRFRSWIDPFPEVRRSDDAILETLFHELAAHAGQKSQGLPGEHSPGDQWLIAPITDADKLARDVHLFFNNPDEDPAIKSVTPNMWERAEGRHTPAVPMPNPAPPYRTTNSGNAQKENVWERAKRTGTPP